MRSGDRSGQIVARKSLGRDEKPVFALERDEAGKKTSGELTLSMTDKPYFRKVAIQSAHGRVTRRLRNLDVVLLESANLFFCGGRHQQFESGLGSGKGLERVLPPLEFTISGRK